jgi:hypothetical protein
VKLQAYEQPVFPYRFIHDSKHPGSRKHDASLGRETSINWTRYHFHEPYRWKISTCRIPTNHALNTIRQMRLLMLYIIARGSVVRGLNLQRHKFVEDRGYCHYLRPSNVIEDSSADHVSTGETTSKIQNERPKQSIPRRAGLYVPTFPDFTIRRAERESKQ